MRGEPTPACRSRRPPRVSSAVDGRPTASPRRVRGVARRCRPDRAPARRRVGPSPPVLVRQVRNGRRGERPPRRHRRGRRRRADAPRHRRPGPHRQPPLGVKPFGAGRRSSRPAASEEFELDARGARDHGEPATPARTSTFARCRPCSGGTASARRLLACGTEGMPLDALTAARLARDGERPARSGTCAPASTRCSCCSRSSAAGRSRRTGRTTTRPRRRYREAVARRVRRRARQARDRHRRLRHPRPTPSRCARSPGRTRSSPTRTAVPAADPRAALAPSLVDDPRRDDRPPGARGRDPRPARHLAHEGGRRAGSSARAAWRGCAASGSCPAPAATGSPRVRASRSRSRTATARTGRPGRRPSRRSGRSACSRARRCACSPATTGRRVLDPHGRVAAEAIAGVRARAGRASCRLTVGDPPTMTFQGDPYRTLGIVAGRVAQRDPLGVPAAREAVPPGRGGRACAAAVPRDPGRLRAAGRSARDGSGRSAARARRPARGAILARRRVAGRGRRARPGGPVGRARRRPAGSPGPAGTASEASGRRRRRGRTGGRGGARGRAAAHGAAPARRERHARRASRKATPGSTTYDEADGDPVRARVGRRRVVRPSSGTYWTINPASTRTPASTGPSTWPAPGARSAGSRRRRRTAGPATAPPDELGTAAGADAPSRSPARGRGRGSGQTTTGGDTADWAARAWTYDTHEAGGATWTPGRERRRRRTPPSPGHPWMARPCRTSRPCSAKGSPRTCCATPGATGSGGSLIALLGWPGDRRRHRHARRPT